MMKKIFFLLPFFIAITCCTRLKAQNAISASDAEQYLRPGSDFLQLRILTADSTIFDTRKIASDKKIVLIMFNPGCEHCMDVTKQMLACGDTLKDCQIVLIAGAPTREFLKDFLKAVDYKKEKTTMVIGTDLDEATPKLFAFNGLPQVNIYDANRKLIDIVYRTIPPSKIRAVLDRTPYVEPKVGRKKRRSKK